MQACRLFALARSLVIVYALTSRYDNSIAWWRSIAVERVDWEYLECTRAGWIGSLIGSIDWLETI